VRVPVSVSTTGRTSGLQNALQLSQKVVCCGSWPYLEWLWKADHHGRLQFLVHSQVTIIFVVSVGLSVCLCRVFLSRLWSDFDQTWTYVVCLGLVESPEYRGCATPGAGWPLKTCILGVLGLVDCTPGREPRSVAASLLHLLQKRTFEYEWRRMRLHNPTNSVKALKETLSTDPCQWPGLILSLPSRSLSLFWVAAEEKGGQGWG